MLAFNMKICFCMCSSHFLDYYFFVSNKKYIAPYKGIWTPPPPPLNSFEIISLRVLQHLWSIDLPALIALYYYELTKALTV